MSLIRLLITIFILNTTIYNANQLQANVTKIDLTPPTSMKIALGGYGERMSKAAEGVHDKIWAKAVVLKKGVKKYVIVTIDILALPPNVKPMLVDILNSNEWSENNIMLLPSHSHTSIDMTAINNSNTLNSPQIGIYQPELLKHVLNKLKTVIKKANKKLYNVKVGTARKKINNMNRNRRGDSTVDNDLTITRIDYENNKPMVALVNWTAHPTFMDESNMLISSGWPGYLQRELEAWIGDDIIVMYYNGAEGDQSPIENTVGSNYEKAENYGRKLAKASINIYKKITVNSNINLSYNYTQVKLPKRKIHPSFMKTGGSEYNMTKKTIDAILNFICPQSTHIGTIQLGELLIVGVPGELVAELGLNVKASLSKKGIKYPTIGGLANEWISYIISEEQYNNGEGYESSISFYGDQLGKIIVNKMKESALVLITE